MLYEVSPPRVPFSGTDPRQICRALSTRCFSSVSAPASIFGIYNHPGQVSFQPLQGKSRLGLAAFLMREAFSATSGANVGYEPRLFVPDTEHPPLAVLRNVSVGAAQRTSNVSHYRACGRKDQQERSKRARALTRRAARPQSLNQPSNHNQPCHVHVARSCRQYLGTVGKGRYHCALSSL
jgi:hypothetical protein